MALHMTLMVNHQQIGHLHIQRTEPFRPPLRPDSWCYYRWELALNGETLASPEGLPVCHRYGDGAWALVAKVLQAAGYASGVGDANT